MTMLVTNPTNIYYLTGFKGLSPQEREALAIVQDDKITLIAPKIYQTEVKKLKNINKVIVSERTQLFPKAIEILKGKLQIKFESEDLHFSEYQYLSTSLSQLDPTLHFYENLRTQKTPSELKKIKKAVEITDKAFTQILKFIKPGQTEKQISQKLQEILENLGSEGLAFEPIIASGSNSALPHHFTSTKKIQQNEVLLLDFGAKFQGYCGDLTRTIFIGKASQEFKDHYQKVLKVQQICLNLAKPNLTAEKLNQIAIDQFGQDAKYFIHGLGHGVGLEIHESPYLKTGITDTLKENMILTIEPGLYFEGKYGIRIEDYGVINKNGFKILSKSPKHLFEI